MRDGVIKVTSYNLNQNFIGFSILEWFIADREGFTFVGMFWFIFDEIATYGSAPLNGDKNSRTKTAFSHEETDIGWKRKPHQSVTQSVDAVFLESKLNSQLFLLCTFQMCRALLIQIRFCLLLLEKQPLKNKQRGFF